MSVVVKNFAVVMSVVVKNFAVVMSVVVKRVDCMELLLSYCPS